MGPAEESYTKKWDLVDLVRTWSHKTRTRIFAHDSPTFGLRIGYCRLDTATKEYPFITSIPQRKHASALSSIPHARRLTISTIVKQDKALGHPNAFGAKNPIRHPSDSPQSSRGDQGAL